MAAPKKFQLCAAAADAIGRAGNMADCMLMAKDGGKIWVSKAVTAVHSRVLGCAAGTIFVHRTIHDHTSSRPCAACLS